MSPIFFIYTLKLQLIKDHAACQSIFSHLHGSKTHIILFWCCFPGGEWRRCFSQTFLLLFPKTWRCSTNQTSLPRFTEQMEAWINKRAEHILSESRPELTAFSLTGFGFLLVALAARRCQRASLLPFICGIISRQQASMAGGVEVTWQI